MLGGYAGCVKPSSLRIPTTLCILATHSSHTEQAALSKGSATEAELHQLIFDIATASRNLVKNQTTWFRDDGMFRCVGVWEWC